MFTYIFFSAPVLSFKNISLIVIVHINEQIINVLTIVLKIPCTITLLIKFHQMERLKRALLTRESGKT